jgi:exosome complex component RRP4
MDYNDIKWLYVPRIGDIIIGTTTNVGLNYWTIDIKSPTSAILPASNITTDGKELHQIISIGESIVAKIQLYDGIHDAKLTVKEPGLGRITRGQLVRVPPSSIPWIIGRKGIMINLIKTETECQIVIGLNGMILVTGKQQENEVLAIQTLNAIMEDSLSEGFFDRIATFLKNKKEAAKNSRAENIRAYCTQCGTENPSGNAFCGKCGVGLRNEETQIY